LPQRNTDGHRFLSTFIRVLWLILSQTIGSAPQGGVGCFFGLPARIVPAEFGLDQGADARHLVEAAVGDEQTQPHAPQEQIFQVDDRLAARRLTQFGND